MIKRFVFRYGLYVMMFMMFVGIFIITSGIKVMNKKTVNVLVTSSNCLLLVPSNIEIGDKKGETVNVYDSNQNLFRFAIDSAEYSRSYTIFYVHHKDGDNVLARRLNGERFISGTVILGQNTLLDILISGLVRKR